MKKKSPPTVTQGLGSLVLACAKVASLVAELRSLARLDSANWQS